jgi:hypothetical protein
MPSLSIGTLTNDIVIVDFLQQQHQKQYPVSAYIFTLESFFISAVSFKLSERMHDCGFWRPSFEQVGLHYGENKTVCSAFIALFS